MENFSMWMYGVLSVIVIIMGMGVYIVLKVDGSPVKIDANTVNEIKYVETDIFKNEVYVECGKTARNMFQKINEKTEVVSERDYLGKKYYWETYEHMLEFILKNGKTIKYDLLFVKKSESSGEVFIRREGTKKAYYMDNEEAKELIQGFSYGCQKGVYEFIK
ncbi:hypothetical protein [Bacillus luti]|nr:hypothetical protein [Bacillus cereus]HDR8329433.1 hypothetical protein [Bacillus cereus]HDR8335963.1 hypothetical protein [Bacillus cereus]